MGRMPFLPAFVAVFCAGASIGATLVGILVR